MNVMPDAEELDQLVENHCRDIDMLEQAKRLLRLSAELRQDGFNGAVVFQVRDGIIHKAKKERWEQWRENR